MNTLTKHFPYRLGCDNSHSNSPAFFCDELHSLCKKCLYPIKEGNECGHCAQSRRLICKDHDPTYDCHNY